MGLDIVPGSEHRGTALDLVEPTRTERPHRDNPPLDQLAKAVAAKLAVEIVDRDHGIAQEHRAPESFLRFFLASAGSDDGAEPAGSDGADSVD